LLVVLLMPYIIHSQEIEPPDMIRGGGDSIRQEYDAFDGPGHPIYRTDNVVIVYLDFTDGRDFSDGITRKQPLYTSQLPNVENLDAAGEIGLTYEVSNYPVNSGLYINASKYKWLDRWNMFFSTDGTYRGSAHPDYTTHHAIYGTQAYGSFSEYWNEVSNGYYKIFPGITHPNETDTRYRTGIVNNYKVMNNGERVIEYIMLPKKKYSADSSQAYFPNENYYSYDYSNTSMERIYMVIYDAEKRLIDLYSHDSLSFNYTDFKAGGGKTIFIFAGSHKKLKGLTFSGLWTICRGMYNKISDQEAQIDGIACIAHEYAHYALNWSHSIGGRNCLMNTNQTKDINCPSHPNPIFKLREGWLNAVHLDSSQSNIQLDPVETSHKVGIVTIYGKPSAAPDHLLGECYVIENRKRIGFDQQLIPNDSAFNLTKGGLLIWHYSPYTDFPPVIGPLSVDYSIKLVTPVNASPDSIFFNNGDVKYFFAYKDNLFPYFTNLLSERTYSQENLKTGIDISNIHQLDYNDVNSKIQLDLNYSISEPQKYDTVIYSRIGSGAFTLSGKIFYHSDIDNLYLNLLPGSQIDIAPGTKVQAKLRGIKASGSLNNPIVVSSPGYKNEYESYNCKNAKLYSNAEVYGSCDSSIFRNINFINCINTSYPLKIEKKQNQNPQPTILENISADFSPQNLECISITYVPVSRVYLNNISIKFSIIKALEDITVSNTNITFIGKSKFSPSKNYIFNNSNILLANNSEFDTLGSNSSEILWKGFTSNNCNINNGNYSIFNNAKTALLLNGGSIDINLVSFKNSETALSLNGLNGINIRNCTFSGNNQDIFINGTSSLDVLRTINHSTFQTPSASQYANISINNVYGSLDITKNTIKDIRACGINLFNCTSVNLNDNDIIGDLNSSVSHGILSYSSGGYYDCNDISKCIYGILLDNSQPVLYNNDVYVNGIGLYITNNSYPIMSPAYLSGYTVYMAGYNKIHNNTGNEIYIKNTGSAVNNLLMSDGLNSIYDDDEIDLIYMNNDDLMVPPEAVKCENNYWGGGDPGSRLNPSGYYNYEPYLTVAPYSQILDCTVSTVSQDNSSKSQDVLLTGNLMNSSLNKDYTSAVSFSNQLSSSDQSIFKKIGFREIYKNRILGKIGINSLSEFYSGQLALYQCDSSMHKYLRNLKIYSEIADSNFRTAILNLDYILMNNNNFYERFYSTIDKLNVLNILDSNYLSGGDNLQQNNLNQMVSTLLKVNNSSGLMKFADKSKSSNTSKTKAVSNVFTDYYERMNSKIQNYSTMKLSDKQNLVNHKILIDLMRNNYIEGLPSFSTKSKYLNEGGTKQNLIPDSYSLSQNYPNPFNPVTKINFAIPKAGMVTIKLYDILGREVSRLVNEFKAAGEYTIDFNADRLSSGVYFYRMETSGFSDIKKMMLLK
jgi:hypothetical protein